ncbi:pseudouridine synthase [Leucogyrophana mollusca]|uniref:Pseudouridine synthase n=1 Tax=Leucogyrophana mollusca TaxID=85980 RepID=A0ACB8B1P8_9AGAM|nr:pseudouridine synthase [Leucogyrophana mollusca]
MQGHQTVRTAVANWARLAIYADRGIIVLNKPPGLICQGSENGAGDVNDETATNSMTCCMVRDGFSPCTDVQFWTPSVAVDLKYRFKLESKPHPVHRLDKSTTGALVLARNASAARQISQQFQTRSIEKSYLALVRGGEKSFTARSGEIRDALDIVDGRVSIGQSCNAKFAATDWELLASSPTAPLSLLRLTLHTGLKHQLRVHLAHALHAPILGETVYTRSPISEKITSVTKVPENRIFLHAARISLSRYRKSGPSKHFRLGIAAPLPRDFVAICKDASIPLDKLDITGGLFVDNEPVAEEVADVEGRWLKVRLPQPRA